MESEIVETVLKDLVQDRAQTDKDVLDLKTKIDALGKAVDRFTTKLDEVKVVVSPTNLTPFNNLVASSVQQIAELIEQQPKAVVRRFQLLLLPETDSKEYYRVLFRFIMPWLAAFFIGFLLVGLGMAYVASNNAIEEKKNNYEIYTGAWWTLDHYYMGKAGRHTMQVILDSCMEAQKKK